jgi:hypothetical protein
MGLLCAIETEAVVVNCEIVFFENGDLGALEGGLTVQLLHV